ncbi:hypothetical protein RJT34_04244 [Clitoria ternatea]|uniref:Uncharacterized protein n=1 Tax=Clitoria ternatea TaxID=43366 RepID=A0AAN9KNP8_CLITE
MASQCSDSSSKKQKGVTQMSSVTVKRYQGEWLDVDLDVNMGIPSGPNATKFSSYLGVLSRTRLNGEFPGDKWESIDCETYDACMASRQSEEFMATGRGHTIQSVYDPSTSSLLVDMCKIFKLRLSEVKAQLVSKDDEKFNKLQ